MIFLLILLAAIGLVVLNRSLNKGEKAIERSKRAESPQSQTPVAKEYTILYAYVAVSAALVIVSLIISLFNHQWATYSAHLQADYQAKGLYFPAQLFQTEIIVATAIGIAVSFVPLIYIVLSRKMKNVIIVLGIYLALSVLGLILEWFVKPDYSILLGLIQTGFTALVFRALLRRKNALL